MSLFPYFQFWRINGEPAINNKCAFAATILIALAITGILVAQFVEVIKRTEVTFTTETIVDELPVKSTVSTFLNLQDPQPYMIGIDVQSGNQGFDASTLKIDAYTSILTGPDRSTRTKTNTPITLEKCTPAHFSTFPGINSVFGNWKASNWWCLPLNKMYNIEGSWALNGNFASIDLFFNCSGTCKDYKRGLNLWFYALTTILNPNNSTKPEQHQIE